ncbi:MAG: Hpt domain-containing protein [Rhodocyclaceae bacterium]|nr:Hpt domain-containing protein [Rhodocyclaceae bacterium]
MLAALIGDDPAMLREFLRDFRASATTIAAELSAACTAGDAAQAGALAHKLKSAALAVGALTLGEICAELEAAGKAGQSAALADMMLRFNAEMARVAGALEKLTAAGASE